MGIAMAMGMEMDKHVFSALVDSDKAVDKLYATYKRKVEQAKEEAKSSASGTGPIQSLLKETEVPYHNPLAGTPWENRFRG
ncbi:MAG: hypothetical protein ACXABY_14910 [Candidatus Thorarchaeota archaeon]|jgi:hypothetical protein